MMVCPKIEYMREEIKKEFDSIRKDDRYINKKHDFIDLDLFLKYFIILVPNLSITYFLEDPPDKEPTFLCHSYIRIGTLFERYWEFQFGEPYTYFVLLSRLFKGCIKANGLTLEDEVGCIELFKDMAHELRESI